MICFAALRWSCILSKFYIKPQPGQDERHHRPGCILSKFYIKPQLQSRSTCANMVVSYRNSTSNHNCRPARTKTGKVVSYRNSTSNHNSADQYAMHNKVVSYRNSTSNHNIVVGQFLFDLVVSYRNSTSNHNPDHVHMTMVQLYLIEILHQTTTGRSFYN